MLEPKGFSTYREAVGIFRAPRAKGVAVMTIDVLIAAIALEHGATLFTPGQGLRKNPQHHLSPSLCVLEVNKMARVQDWVQLRKGRAPVTDS